MTIKEERDLIEKTYNLFFEAIIIIGNNKDTKSYIQYIAQKLNISNDIDFMNYEIGFYNWKEGKTNCDGDFTQNSEMLNDYLMTKVYIFLIKQYFKTIELNENIEINKLGLLN